MNTDMTDRAASALLGALPYITTFLDTLGRVVQQLNSEGTPLFTPPGETFLSSAPELSAALQTATNAHFETQLLPHAGDPCWFEHDVVFAPGSPIVVISRDITGRKAAEAEHTRIKRRYDAILGNTGDAVTISTWGETYDNAKLLYANQRAQELLGYSFEELLTMRPSDVLAADYKPTAFQRHLERSSGQWLNMPPSFPIIRKDGEIRQVQSLGIMIQEDDGTIVEAIALVRDVTERIQREEQLFQAKLAAEAALSARDVFVANMSEELRQPLRDILEHTRLLLASAGLPPDLIERLHRIHDQTENLDHQIGDILDLSRVEAGFDAVRLSVFNLPHLLRRLEETQRLRAQQQALTLRFEGVDDLPILIRSDETKLKQILVNVIEDALKATAHGSVSVRALRLPDHVLRFEVADTRKSGAHSPDDESTMAGGFGIAISARLVDVLSGKLEFTQTAEGMILTIDLPFVPVHSDASDDEAPALPSQEQLERLPEAWLYELYAFCLAGQVEQALVHVQSLDPAQSATAVQLSALITLFQLDRIADALEPLLDPE